MRRSAASIHTPDSQWGQGFHSDFNPTAMKLMKKGRGVVKSGSHSPQVALPASMRAQVSWSSILGAGPRDDPASGSTHEFRVLVPNVQRQPRESSREGCASMLTDFSLLSAASAAAERASVLPWWLEDAAASLPSTW